MNSFNLFKDEIKNCQTAIKIKSDEYYIIKIGIDGSNKLDDMCSTLLLKPCENLPVLCYCDDEYIYLCFSRIVTKHEYNGNVGKIASEYTKFLYQSYENTKLQKSTFLCSIKVFSDIPQLYFYLCEKVYNKTIRTIKQYDKKVESVNEFITYNKPTWEKIKGENKYGFFFTVKKKCGESVIEKKIYPIDGNSYNHYSKLLFNI
jgi:hypothetical protein